MTKSSSFSRRDFVAGSAAALSAPLFTFTASQSFAQKAGSEAAIRPFRVSYPQADLTDLRMRIKATKWPERETVADASQGVQLAPMQALARYWASDYDWRKCEARLNSWPQFMTEIDGLDIHFIHVRSTYRNAAAAHRHARMARSRSSSS